jgi:hypothetical protein
VVVVLVFVGGAADVVIEGPSVGGAFGTRLAVGDFDGDGVDDLAVSAPFDDAVGQDSGAVYVLAGPARR